MDKKNFKIVTLGDGRVGKTSLIMKFVDKTFEESTSPTINASYLEKEVLVNNTSVRLLIWDTAGQERYKALAPNYYRQAKGAILVYDITDKSSFDRVKHWVKELTSQADKNINIIIAANKSDRESERNLNREEACAYAQSIGAPHIATSAKTGKGVTELFQMLAELVNEAHQKEKQEGQKSQKWATRSKGITLAGLKKPPRKKACC